MKPRLDRTTAVHHVYQCFAVDGRLLYVGSTGDLFGRLTAHRRSSWWAPQVARVTAKVYPNGVVARTVERRIIREERPRWNKAGKWETHHAWDQSEWDDWLTVLFKQAKFPTPEIYARISDYRALWGCDVSDVLLAQLASLEAERMRVKADLIEREAAHKVRVAEIEREDQLAELRERRERRS